MYLPPSELISDRLLNAVEAFYMAPTHETPRNAYEFERCERIDRNILFEL